MACGLPIVARDTARVRWIVGDDQFLTGDEPAAIAKQIVAASNARHQYIGGRRPGSIIFVDKNRQDVPGVFAGNRLIKAFGSCLKGNAFAKGWRLAKISNRSRKGLEKA